MKRFRQKLGVVENLGWLDRTIRVAFGASLISIPCYYLITGSLMSPWYAFLMLLAVYPIMTGVLGTDLLYNMFGIKSCDTSERNVCGTFPYEIDAALGRKPVSNSDIERRLENAHHENSGRGEAA
ncbi:MAG: DUF2892 domain-containing protein [Gammaproteobacteria bacterium]|jgi:hypothetical protein